jgi:type VI secretion system secreted protein VgrG
VVGKAGEEIWTDQYGRIKVQFHWDRQGKQDESSSCWVRVSQSWAGKGWGSMFIPRVGMEVVVSFLEGDPDRPLVTGCVYNSGAMPPYALPGEQTKSTLKSNSSKGGSGFNELRFEDKAGAEEVFVHAQKDFSRVVLNDDALEVSGKQTVAIKGDQTVTVNGDQSITVNKTIVIEATTSIELKVGGSSIKIEPAQITLKSTQITLNAEAGMQLKAGATMDLDGGGMLTAKAGLVKINWSPARTVSGR